MNIFQYAKKLEQDGEDYYRKMAEKVNDKGIESIFNMLAKDEVKHYQTFDKMEKEEQVEMDETEILSDTVNIFEQRKEKGEDFDTDEDQIDIYREAKDLEQETIDFYEEKAEEVDNKKYKELFLKIAGEEKKHYHLLDNIEELLLRPKQWVEDAEFYHIEDY